ncbi:mRNA turnover protein 4 homolog [Amphiura filiformis]|uniref:mRNA turnover protein 4 homolog n=1 Tax=Amphiura filiformis TaxID=82378 RepID=UPI003B227BE4
MPKSKRFKKVSLTQTKKKGLETKQKLIEEIRSCVDNYARLFIFSVENMRNSKIKDVRNMWKHSRFFFGKNKVMAVALGKSSEAEYRDGLHDMSKRLLGNVGLLFTNDTEDEVLRWFEKYAEPEFARSGNKATISVTLDEGPLNQFPHNMEPQLRKLGLPTLLKKGVITLLAEHKVCKEGDTLTPEQTRMLKLLGHATVEFKFELKAMWTNNGVVKDLVSGKEIQPNRTTKVAAGGSEGEEEHNEEEEEEEDDDDDEDSD